MAGGGSSTLFIPIKLTRILFKNILISNKVESFHIKIIIFTLFCYAFYSFLHLLFFFSRILLYFYLIYSIQFLNLRTQKFCHNSVGKEWVLVCFLLSVMTLIVVLLKPIPKSVINNFLLCQVSILNSGSNI